MKSCYYTPSNKNILNSAIHFECGAPLSLSILFERFVSSAKKRKNIGKHFFRVPSLTAPILNNTRWNQTSASACLMCGVFH